MEEGPKASVIGAQGGGERSQEVESPEKLLVKSVNRGKRKG